jgi:outer membrane protein OmpA-like peptidoglycan-associated protein
MKYGILGVICIVTLLLNTTFAQQQVELTPGYYVVAASYAKSKEQIAQSYVDALQRKGINAHYGFNSGKGMYFVYLEYFDNLKSSLGYMQKAREQEEFKGAWVRVVPGVVTNPPITVSESAPSLIERSDSEKSEPVYVEEYEITENEPFVQYAKMTLGNTEVFLSLYYPKTNRIVDATIEVTDTERERSIQRVPGNTYLILPDPKSSSSQLQLTCDAFGYKKVQREINYASPLQDTSKSYIDLMGTTLVVHFEMERLMKGDVSILNGVTFFNDAAIMRPDSKGELQNLLELLQESPTTKVKLHGHTNGNYRGKIITASSNANLFTLDGAIHSLGSAKDLSLHRANAIKAYLVANGIAADRIEVKGWGGKKPLYNKLSANAIKNVRVEVEITEG